MGKWEAENNRLKEKVIDRQLSRVQQLATRRLVVFYSPNGLATVRTRKRMCTEYRTARTYLLSLEHLVVKYFGNRKRERGEREREKLVTVFERGRE